MGSSKQQGQALVEFALILPLLLLMIMGIVDFGRALFTYGQASSQLREALRQAAAIGLPGGGIPPYRDCPNMRSLARKVYFSQPIEDDDISIQYARVASSPKSTFSSGDFIDGLAECTYDVDGVSSSTGEFGPSDLANGDVLRMSETVSIDMITPFFPTRNLTFKLQGQRSVITKIDMASLYCGNLVCDPGEGNPDDPGFCVADCSQSDIHMYVSSSTPTGEVYTTLEYTFTVKNDRPLPGFTYGTPAANVKVTYQLPDPDDVMYLDCTAPAGASCGVSGGQVIWNLGTVPWSTTAFKTIKLRIVPKVEYPASDPLWISALVTTTGLDPHNDPVTCDPTGPGDNVACMKTTVTDPTKDIRISASSNVPSGGLDFDQNIVFTLIAYKNGSGTPTGVHLALDGIPTDFIFVSADTGCSYSSTAGTVDCNLGTPTTYPVFKSITLQAHKDGTFNSTGTISWNASSFTDTIPGNNSESFSYIVKPPKAGLSIRKQLTSAGTTNIGATIKYSLIVSNAGPNMASTPVVVDTFPVDPDNPWAAVDYQSYSVSPADSVLGVKQEGPHGSEVTWTLANMAKGATVTININARAQSDGEWENKATVSSTTYDDNIDDNTDTVIVTTKALPQVTNVSRWKLRCTGIRTRRYMGLSWNRVTGAEGYYIYANGKLVGQTTDGIGKITNCGLSVSRSRPGRISGCYNLAPRAWAPATTVIYTIAAFITSPALLTGPQSKPVKIKC